LFHKL